MTETNLFEDEVLWWSAAAKGQAEALAKKLDPKTKLVRKDKSPLWRFVAWFLFLVSFGYAKRERMYEWMAVTIGRRVYIPSTWTLGEAIAVLPHEVLGHVAQYKRYGLGIHWLGIVPFLVIYFLVPFPILWAYGRAYLEAEAVKADWDYRADYIGAEHLSMELLRIDVNSWVSRIRGKGYAFALLSKTTAKDIFWSAAVTHITRKVGAWHVDA
jgi:hypothetical protein